MSAPPTLEDLQVVVSLDAPSGATIAMWHNEYCEAGPAFVPMLNLCVTCLHERGLCYACGEPGDRLVAGDFPWVCASCELET